MKTLSSAWIACAALFAPCAALAENCADTGFVTQAAAECRGSIGGDLGGDPSEVAYLNSQWGGGWSFAGKSNDTSNGPFTGNPEVAFSGALTFDAPVSGDFIIGLQAGGQHSYYLFRGAVSLGSLSFDSTEGVATSIQGNPLALSHAALYVSAVPEPGAWALLTVGLLAVGLRAQRRA